MVGDSISSTMLALSTEKNGVSRAVKPRSGSKTEVTLRGTAVPIAAISRVETGKKHYSPRFSGFLHCHTSRDISPCLGKYPSCFQVCSLTHKCQDLRQTSPGIESKTERKERKNQRQNIQV